MDTVTTIRIVAGIIAVLLLAFLVARRKKMASVKRLSSKR